MHEIEDFTLGWDTRNNEGFVTVKDKSGKVHLLDHLASQDFMVVLTLLKQKGLLLDNHSWLISGWQKEH